MFRKRLLGFLLAFSMILSDMRPVALAVTEELPTEAPVLTEELAPELPREETEEIIETEQTPVIEEQVEIPEEETAEETVEPTEESAPTEDVAEETEQPEAEPVETPVVDVENTETDSEPAEDPSNFYRPEENKLPLTGDRMNSHEIVKDPETTDWFTWVYYADKESDFTPDPMLIPGYWDYQWFHNTIDSYKAWGSTQGSSDVTVAIVGGGVAKNGELLDNGDLLYPDYDDSALERIDLNEIPTDYYGETWSHSASMAAGLIGGRFNGEYGAGVAPGVSIRNYNITDYIVDENGESYWVFDIGDMAEAIERAVTDDSDIIFIDYSDNWDEYVSADVRKEIENAIRNAYNNGIPVITHTGYGDENTVTYPAAMDETIAVAGTTANGYVIPKTPYGNWVDISAPGDNIFSGNLGNAGPSDAAAIATGVAALYMSVTDREFTSGEDVEFLRELMRKSGTKPATKGLPNIVNAAKMLESVIATPVFEFYVGGEIVEDFGDPLLVDFYREPAEDLEPSNDYITFADTNEELNFFIAYTLNGKAPKVTNGVPAAGTEIYDPDKGIDLTQIVDGKYTLTATAYNKLGKNSAVVKQAFTVKHNIAQPGEDETPDAVIEITGPDSVVKGKKATFKAEFTQMVDGFKDTILWKVTDMNGEAVPGVTITNKGVVTVKNTVTDTEVYVVAYGKTSGIFTEHHLELKEQAAEVIIDAAGYTDTEFEIEPNVYLVNENEDRVDLYPTALDKGGNILYSDPTEFTWKSSSTKIAEVNAYGQVTIKNSGTVKITATVNDGSKKLQTVTLQIVQPVDSVEINAPVKSADGEFYVANGSKVKFTADILPLGASDKSVKFYLVDADALEPMGIKIDAKGNLSVNVKREFGEGFSISVGVIALGPTLGGKDVQDQVDVQLVKNKAKAVSVNLQEEDYELITKTDKLGNVSALTMYYLGEENENSLNLVAAADNGVPVGFKSSNPDIVSVDGYGKITAGAKAGKATITMTALDGSNKSSKVNVTVANGLDEFEFTNIAENETLNLSAGNKFAFKYTANGLDGKKFSGKMEWLVDWVVDNGLDISDYVTMKNGTLTVAKDISDVADGTEVVVTLRPVDDVPGSDKEITATVALRTSKAKSIRLELLGHDVNVPVGTVFNVQYTVLDTEGDEIVGWEPPIGWTISNKKTTELIATYPGMVTFTNNGTAGKVTITAKASDGSNATGKITVNFVNQITGFALDTTDATLIPGAKLTVKTVDIETQTGAKPTINKFDWLVYEKGTDNVLDAESGVTVKNGVVTVAKDCELKGFDLVVTATDGSGSQERVTVEVTRPIDSIYVGIPLDIKNDIDDNSDLYDILDSLKTHNTKTGCIDTLNLFTLDIPNSEFDLINDEITINESVYMLQASGIVANDEVESGPEREIFTGGAFDWTTSNDDIVSIDVNEFEENDVVNSYAQLTAHKAGTAKITVTAKDGSNKKVTFNVKVSVPVSHILLSYTGKISNNWRNIPDADEKTIIVANGKTAKFVATAGDDFGKPTNSKLDWLIDDSYEEWDETTGEWIPKVYGIKATIKNGTLTIAKDNTASGWLTVAACSTDGSARVAETRVFVPGTVTTFNQAVTYSNKTQVYRFVNGEYVLIPASAYADMPRSTTINRTPMGEGYYEYWFISDGMAGAVQVKSSNPEVATAEIVKYKETTISMKTAGRAAEDFKLYIDYKGEKYPIQVVGVKTTGKEGSAKITVTSDDGTNKSFSFTVKTPNRLDSFKGNYYGNKIVGEVNGNSLYETLAVSLGDKSAVTIDGKKFTAKPVEPDVYPKYMHNENYSGDSWNEVVMNVWRLSGNGEGETIDLMLIDTCFEGKRLELRFWENGYNSEFEGHTIADLTNSYRIPKEFQGEWFYNPEGVEDQFKVEFGEYSSGSFYIKENGWWEEIGHAYNFRYEKKSGKATLTFDYYDYDTWTTDTIKLDVVFDEDIGANYLLYREDGLEFRRDPYYYESFDLTVQDIEGKWFYDTYSPMEFTLSEYGDGLYWMKYYSEDYLWKLNGYNIERYGFEDGEPVLYRKYPIKIEAHGDKATLVFEDWGDFYYPQENFAPEELVAIWKTDQLYDNGVNRTEYIELKANNTVKILSHNGESTGTWMFDYTDNYERLVTVFNSDGTIYKQFTYSYSSELYYYYDEYNYIEYYESYWPEPVDKEQFIGLWSGWAHETLPNGDTRQNEVVLEFMEDGKGKVVQGDNANAVTGETFKWDVNFAGQFVVWGLDNAGNVVKEETLENWGDTLAYEKYISGNYEYTVEFYKIDDGGNGIIPYVLYANWSPMTNNHINSSMGSDYIIKFIDTAGNIISDVKLPARQNGTTVEKERLDGDDVYHIRFTKPGQYKYTFTVAGKKETVTINVSLRELQITGEWVSNDGETIIFNMNGEILGESQFKYGTWGTFSFETEDGKYWTGVEICKEYDDRIYSFEYKEVNGQTVLVDEYGKTYTYNGIHADAFTGDWIAYVNGEQIRMYIDSYGGGYIDYKENWTNIDWTKTEAQRLTIEINQYNLGGYGYNEYVFTLNESDAYSKVLLVDYNGETVCFAPLDEYEFEGDDGNGGNDSDPNQMQIDDILGDWRAFTDNDTVDLNISIVNGEAIATYDGSEYTWVYTIDERGMIITLTSVNSPDEVIELYVNTDINGAASCIRRHDGIADLKFNRLSLITDNVITAVLFAKWEPFLSNEFHTTVGSGYYVKFVDGQGNNLEDSELESFDNECIGISDRGNGIFFIEILKAGTTNAEFTVQGNATTLSFIISDNGNGGNTNVALTESDFDGLWYTQDFGYLNIEYQNINGENILSWGGAEVFLWEYKDGNILAYLAGDEDTNADLIYGVNAYIDELGRTVITLVDSSGTVYHNEHTFAPDVVCDTWVGENTEGTDMWTVSLSSNNRFVESTINLEGYWTYNRGGEFAYGQIVLSDDNGFAYTYFDITCNENGEFVLVYRNDNNDLVYMERANQASENITMMIETGEWNEFTNPFGTVVGSNYNVKFVDENGNDITENIELNASDCIYVEEKGNGIFFLEMVSSGIAQVEFNINGKIFVAEFDIESAFGASIKISEDRWERLEGPYAARRESTYELQFADFIGSYYEGNVTVVDCNREYVSISKGTMNNFYIEMLKTGNTQIVFDVDGEEFIAEFNILEPIGPIYPMVYSNGSWQQIDGTIYSEIGYDTTIKFIDRNGNIFTDASYVFNEYIYSYVDVETIGDGTFVISPKLPHYVELKFKIFEKEITIEYDAAESTASGLPTDDQIYQLFRTWTDSNGTELRFQIIDGVNTAFLGEDKVYYWNYLIETGFHNIHMTNANDSNDTFVLNARFMEDSITELDALVRDDETGFTVYMYDWSTTALSETSTLSVEAEDVAEEPVEDSEITEGTAETEEILVETEETPVMEETTEELPVEQTETTEIVE